MFNTTKSIELCQYVSAITLLSYCVKWTVYCHFKNVSSVIAVMDNHCLTCVVYTMFREAPAFNIEVMYTLFTIRQKLYIVFTFKYCIFQFDTPLKIVGDENRFNRPQDWWSYSDSNRKMLPCKGNAVPLSHSPK